MTVRRSSRKWFGVALRNAYMAFKSSLIWSTLLFCLHGASFPDRIWPISLTYFRLLQSSSSRYFLHSVPPFSFQVFFPSYCLVTNSSMFYFIPWTTRFAALIIDSLFAFLVFHFIFLYLFLFFLFSLLYCYPFFSSISFCLSLSSFSFFSLQRSKYSIHSTWQNLQVARPLEQTTRSATAYFYPSWGRKFLHILC